MLTLISCALVPLYAILGVWAGRRGWSPNKFVVVAGSFFCLHVATITILHFGFGV